MLFHDVRHGGHAVADPQRGRLLEASSLQPIAAGPDFDPDAMTAFRYWFEASPGDLLPTATSTVQALDALGAAMIDQAEPATADATIPPVYTYWSQFIDHELTARTDRGVASVSEIDKPANEVVPSPRATVEAQLKNRRTPALELDSVYGDGPPNACQDLPADELELARMLRVGARMRIGTVATGNGIPGVVPPPETDLNRDLPRIGPLIDAGVVTADQFPAELQNEPNFRSRAFIGDPRNDENLVVAQFHAAMLRFHNAIVDRLEPGHTGSADALFEKARAIARWTFQWLVVNDFLKTVADPGIVDDVVTNRAPRYRALFNRAGEPVLPLEFSVAAYRFGHSMIRGAYDHNRNFGRGESPLIPSSPLNLLFRFTGSFHPAFTPGGTAPAPFETLPFNWIIEWERFTGAAPAAATAETPARLARKIDARLAPPLGDLLKEGGSASGDILALLKHLARRNLRRGYVLGLPTGQAAARAFDLLPLTGPELLDGLDNGVAAVLTDNGFVDRTPLWFYILREAEIAGGNRLGALGSAMVAETLVGVLVTDPFSYLAQQPDWFPGKPIAGIGPSLPLQGKQTRIGDVLRFFTTSQTPAV